MSKRNIDNGGTVPTRVSKTAKKQIRSQKNGNGRQVPDYQIIETWRQCYNEVHSSVEQEINNLIVDVKSKISRIMDRHSVPDERRHLINQQLQMSLMLLSDAAEEYLDPEAVIQRISSMRQQLSDHPDMQAFRKMQKETPGGDDD